MFAKYKKYPKPVLLVGFSLAIGVIGYQMYLVVSSVVGLFN